MISFNFSGLNQNESNDWNEEDIIQKSRIAQLGRFSDMKNGNTSTLFYGGIIFPADFDYDDVNNTKCTNSKCINMNYTIRFLPEFTSDSTGIVYNPTAGPGDTGRKDIHV